MTQRNAMVDEVYVRLVNAPNGLNCSIDQVLVALGMMASAVLRQAFSDPSARQDKLAWFCTGLRRSIDRSHKVTTH